jgi:hypothetical protein
MLKGVQNPPCPPACGAPRRNRSLHMCRGASSFIRRWWHMKHMQRSRR